MKIVGRRLRFLISLVVVSAACGDLGVDPPANTPDVVGPQFSQNLTDCTSVANLHEDWPVALPDGPASELMTPANCVKLQDAIDFMNSSGNSFLEGIGQWANYFYSTNKFSQWGFLGAHSHPIPEPIGSGANDIIVIHYENLDGPLNELIAAVCHEITHSQEWGITHETSPSNGDIGAYCYDVASGDPPSGPPPPPPPDPPCC